MKKVFLGVALALLPGIGVAENPPAGISDVDFSRIANIMYSTYMNYQNGATAMMGAEQQCWKDAGKDLNLLNSCVVSAITGGLIEAGYAMREGRVSIPDYQGQIMRERILKKFSERGLSEMQAQSLIEYTSNNVQQIVMSLANAGMR